ncbi:hypothetical protein [Mycobacterium lacus]
MLIEPAFMLPLFWKPEFPLPVPKLWLPVFPKPTLLLPRLA